MPPRKKVKGSARAPSTPVADEDAMAVDTPQQTPKPVGKPAKSEDDLLKDPWTDEQETSLFKGLIKWKPNGVHKHFRMIALSEHLRNHGYDPRIEKHTRIPGIWHKLRTLYNMDIIDERENSFEYEEDLKDRFLEFKLPEEDFDEVLFMKGKRVGSYAGSSPPRLNASPSPQPPRKRKRGDTVVKHREASIVEDTDEAKTSPAHSPPPKSTTRAGRSTNRSMGRVKAESRSRQPSKDTTADEEVEEDADEAEEDEEEAEEEEEEEEEEEGTPSPKASKGKSRDAPAKAQNPSRKSKRKR